MALLSGLRQGESIVSTPSDLVKATIKVVALLFCLILSNTAVAEQLPIRIYTLRYKTNIAPFTPGLTLLNKLNPITFNCRSDNSADLGFGAEDIAEVEPLLVIKNEPGQVEGVKYDRITAVLINAIKEQQQQIKELKKLVCARNRRAAACQ